MNKIVKIAYYIVSWTFIIVICGLLFGCARHTPVESAFNDAHQAIVVAKDSLPAECQTSEILEKLNSAEVKYEKAQSVCEAKIKDVQIKYERTLGILFLIIFVFFAKILIKK